MIDDDDRLMRCFELAFPSATRDEVRAAEFNAISGWDSLRGVTLLAILEEEFGVEIELPMLLDLKTFDVLKRYLLQLGIISEVNK